MSIFISILSFLGCKSKEERFLDSHQILFCKTDKFKKFLFEAKIKPEEAKEMMIDFAEKNNIRKPHLLYFVIDEHYVFTSYAHLKVPEASTKGIWVNANNGKIKEVKNGLFIRAYHKYEWRN